MGNLRHHQYYRTNKGNHAGTSGYQGGAAAESSIPSRQDSHMVNESKKKTDDPKKKADATKKKEKEDKISSICILTNELNLGREWWLSSQCKKDFQDPVKIKSTISHQIEPNSRVSEEKIEEKDLMDLTDNQIETIISSITKALELKKEENRFWENADTFKATIEAKIKARKRLRGAQNEKSPKVVLNPLENIVCWFSDLWPF